MSKIVDFFTMLSIDSNSFSVDAYVTGRTSSADIVTHLEDFSAHDLVRMLPLLSEPELRASVAERLLAENTSADIALTVLICCSEKILAPIFELAAIRIAEKGSASQFSHALLCISHTRILQDGSSFLWERCVELWRTRSHSISEWSMLMDSLQRDSTKLFFVALRPHYSAALRSEQMRVDAQMTVMHAVQKTS
jgi:hypothetical protein